MAQPGKYSNVEVLRKNVVGADVVAGTTQMVGSGLNPRSTGLRKVETSAPGSESGAAVVPGSPVSAAMIVARSGDIWRNRM